MVRKIFEIGNSRAIIIPKGWLDFYEKDTGQKIVEVAIEVNKVLTIEPVLAKKEPVLNKKKVEQ